MLGHLLYEAEECREAIKQFTKLLEREKNHLDALIDLGRALADRLRADHARMKLLLISDFAHQEPAASSRVDDDPALIQKPFSPPELLQRMRTILDGEQA